MSKKAVDKVAAGLRDAIAIARGEIKSARIPRAVRDGLAQSVDCQITTRGRDVTRTAQHKDRR